MPADWQRTAERNFSHLFRASPVVERGNNAEANDASYLRNRLTFSGICLKSPSNWSLAHWKKRQEKQIKRQTCLVKWGVFTVCKNAFSDDIKAVFMKNVIPMLVPHFGVRLKYFKYLIIFHRHL